MRVRHNQKSKMVNLVNNGRIECIQPLADAEELINRNEIAKFKNLSHDFIIQSYFTSCFGSNSAYTNYT